MMRRSLGILVVGLVVAMYGVASASPLDLYGLGSRASSMAGAATAGSHEGEAAYYAPSGLALGTGTTLSIGYGRSDFFVDVSGSSSGTEALDTLRLSLSAGGSEYSPWPLGLRLGVQILLPTDSVYQVSSPDDESMSMLFMDDYAKRLVVHMGGAIRPWDWLAIGGGISLLPDVYGGVSVDLADPEGQNDLLVDVTFNVAPVASISLVPWDFLEVVLAYRGSHETHVVLPVEVSVSKQVAPVAARMEALSYFMPHRIALGVSLHLFDELELSADVTWHLYSKMSSPFGTVSVLNDDGATMTSDEEGIEFHDVIVPRLGLSFDVMPALTIRGGYAYQPSPVPDQPDLTNILDTSRHVASVGLGIDLGKIAGPGLLDFVIDLHAQCLVLSPRVEEKLVLDPENPGYPSWDLEGVIINYGIDLVFAWP